MPQSEGTIQLESEEVSPMMAFSEILDKVSAVFTSSTGTGLEVLDSTPAVERVAMELFTQNLIPATTSDIAAAHRTVLGSDATVEDVLDVENYLLGFGWLR